MEDWMLLPDLIRLFFAGVSVTTSRHMLYSPENQGRLRSVCLLSCPDGILAIIQKLYGL
jgi:hypothetical protein